jgi:hypothetical protein
MTTVNIHEAKTHLSRYVEQAAAGEEVIIARPASRWPDWSRWNRMNCHRARWAC